ncbi:hypothetical protein [Streptomyces albogriseolus]
MCRAGADLQLRRRLWRVAHLADVCRPGSDGQAGLLACERALTAALDA